jgi:hypothetical protein
LKTFGKSLRMHNAASKKHKDARQTSDDAV